MKQSIYQINGLPIGYSVPRSAREIIQGLSVQAEIIGNKAVVTKNAIVEKLRAVNQQWADFWNNAKENRFEFSM
jgi:hypothetical protein